MRFSVRISVGLLTACVLVACTGPGPVATGQKAATTKPSAMPSSSVSVAPSPPGSNVADAGSNDSLAQLTGVVTIPTVLTVRAGGSIVASGGGNIVASGGGNIVSQGAGNIVASGGGNLIGPNGATYHLTATDEEVPLANTEVALALGNGDLVMRKGKALVVRTDDQGNYRFPPLAAANRTFQVVVFARTNQGKPARLKALTRLAAEGAVADISVASTLVTTNALKGRSKLGDLDVEALRSAVQATRKALAADPVVDLTDDAKVGDRMDKVTKADPVIQQAMVTVGTKLELNAPDPAAVASAIDQAPVDEIPVPTGLCALALEQPVLLTDESGKPATFGLATAVAVDATPKVYVADRFAGKVLAFQATGGKGEAIGDDPGAGSLAVGKSAIFVGAPRENTINRYLAGAALPILKAGTPFAGVPAASIDPAALAAADDGTLYVADSNKGRVFKATIGADGAAPVADVVRGTATLKGPGGLAIDAKGNLFVSDTYAHCIRKVTPDGQVSVLAGVENEPGEPGSASEAAGKAHFYQPRGLAVAADGTVYVADSGNQAIRVIKDDKVTTLVALQCGGVDPERLSALGGIALSPDNRWLFVANGLHVVRFTVVAAASPAPSASPTTKADATATP